MNRFPDRHALQLANTCTNAASQLGCGVHFTLTSTLLKMQDGITK